MSLILLFLAGALVRTEVMDRGSALEITVSVDPESLTRTLQEAALPALSDRPYIPYVDIHVALPGPPGTERFQTTWSPLSLPGIPVLQVGRDGLDLQVNFTHALPGSAVFQPEFRVHTFQGYRYATVRIPLLRIREGRPEFLSSLRLRISLPSRGKGSGSPPAALKRLVVNPQHLVRIGRVTLRRQSRPPSASFWVQIPIPRSGLYALTGKDLATLGLEGLRLDATAVFCTDGDTLDGRNVTDVFSPLRRVPILVLDGTTPGVLDPEDTLLFYAEGPRRYRFEAGDWVFFEHPYADTLFCYLAAGTAPSPSLPDSALSGPGVPLDEGLFFFRHERNQVNLARKGLRWEGEEFFRPAGTSTLDTVIAFSLDPPPTGKGRIRFAFVSARAYPDYREIRWQVGDDRGTDSLRGFITDACVRGCEDSLHALPPSGTIRFTLRWFRAEEDLLYLDYAEIQYRARLSVSSQRFVHFATVDTGLRQIEIVGTPRWVLDVTDPTAPIRITGLTRNGDRTTFIWAVQESTRMLLASTPLRPPGLRLVDLSALWHVSTPADFVLIYPRSLAAAVGPYLAWRKNRIPRFDGTRWIYAPGEVAAFAIEDIFTSFGFGTRDPVALRNFFVYLAEQGAVTPGSTFVLLLGDGTYDYKNFSGTGGNLIPPYEPFEAIDVNEYAIRGAWDEFFVDLDGSGGSVAGELMIGRLPVRSADEAYAYLEMLKRYERADLPGPWRNRVVLVSDDEYAEGRSSEAFHMISTQRVYQTIPTFMEVTPVYLIQYPRSERPTRGQDALVEAFNRGSLFLNFFGHGNPVTLTHENILPPSAYSRLQASHRPTLAVFASCKVGAFDRLEPEAVLGELFLQKGLAIGTISSSALSFAFANEVYVIAMTQAALSGPLPLGMLYLQGKNQPYYLLLGDPAVLFRFPATASWSASLPDTFWSAQTFTYSATAPDSLYLASLRIPPRDTTYTGGVTITYTRPAIPLFTGPVTGPSPQGEAFVPILQGVDSLEFVLVEGHGREGLLPERRPYRASGTLPVGGGPSIQAWLEETPLAEGKKVLVPERSRLRVVLEDPEGITLQGGLRVSALSRSWDLSAEMTFPPGDFRQAVVEAFLTLPPADSFDLVVEATDNVGQTTRKRFPVGVLQATGKGIVSFLPYPNPWRRGDGPLSFTFVLGKPGRVSLKIFSVAGKEVYRFPEVHLPAGFHRWTWRGTSTSGWRLGGGVYFALLVWKGEGEREEKTTGILIIP